MRNVGVMKFDGKRGGHTDNGSSFIQEKSTSIYVLEKKTSLVDSPAMIRRRCSLFAETNSIMFHLEQ